MRKRTKLFPVVVITMALLAAACSSSPSAKGGGSSTTSVSTGTSTNKGTVTIGVLADITGLGSSASATTEQGIKAGVSYAKDHGYTVKYVVADTQSSPAGLQSAVQELVDQDHVLAVVSVSALTFLVAKTLTQDGVPVIGVAEDGPEWVTSDNMFSTFGATDASLVATTPGQFFKKEGATTIGSLGYGISPQSADAAESTAVSAVHAGLKTGYLNANFQYGSTNVQPIALAMKAAGVNGMTASVLPDSGLQLVTALRQAGANIKVAVLPTGYGGDLQQAGPGALSSAQNVYFLSVFEPVEMHTAATEQFQKYSSDAGVSGDPTYAEYAGYTSVVLLVQGLEGAGSNPTQAGLIAALSKITNFDAAGLLGSHTVDFAHKVASPTGPDNCEYYTKLSGSKFKLVSGADPLCGTVIAGEKVGTPSS